MKKKTNANFIEFDSTISTQESIVYSIETLSRNLCRLIKEVISLIFKDTYLIPGTLGISHDDLGRSMKP